MKQRLEELFRLFDSPNIRVVTLVSPTDQPAKKEGSVKERAQATVAEIRSRLADSPLVKERLELMSERYAGAVQELDEQLALTKRLEDELLSACTLAEYLFDQLEQPGTELTLLRALEARLQQAADELQQVPGRGDLFSADVVSALSRIHGGLIRDERLFFPDPEELTPAQAAYERALTTWRLVEHQKGSLGWNEEATFTLPELLEIFSKAIFGDESVFETLQSLKKKEPKPQTKQGAPGRRAAKKK